MKDETKWMLFAVLAVLVLVTLYFCETHDLDQVFAKPAPPVVERVVKTETTKSLAPFARSISPVPVAIPAPVDTQ